MQISGYSVIHLNVNGQEVSVMIKPSHTLLYVLREKLSLTGAKSGCNNGDCGACTVLIDDMPVKSCLMLAVEAVGHKITTIEGLENGNTRGFCQKLGISVRILYVRFFNGLSCTGKV